MNGSRVVSSLLTCFFFLFLLLFQRKKSAVSYLNSPLHQGTRKRGAYDLRHHNHAVEQLFLLSSCYFLFPIPSAVFVRNNSNIELKLCSFHRHTYISRY